MCSDGFLNNKCVCGGDVQSRSVVFVFFLSSLPASSFPSSSPSFPSYSSGTLLLHLSHSFIRNYVSSVDVVKKPRAGGPRKSA